MLRLTEFTAVVAALLVAGSFNPPFQKTGDDSAMLFRFLEKQNSKQVLGVSTNTPDPCPSDRPIIGWINFQGQKTIQDSLSPEASASACFHTVEEAQSQGYTQPE
jgi:hypothetical protein